MYLRVFFEGKKRANIDRKAQITSLMEQKTKKQYNFQVFESQKYHIQS